MKAWLYARVSTSGNRCRACNKDFKDDSPEPMCPVCSSADVEKSQETENQLMAMRQWMKQLGHEVVAEYVDRASGKSGERQEFKRMFFDAERRRPRHPIILGFWALDRLTREGTVETLTYLKKLNDLGVEWKSKSEEYLDSTGPFRDAVIAILAAIAKQERLKTIDRTMAGLARARLHGTRSGKAIGRPEQFSRERCAALVESLGSRRKAARVLGVSLAAVIYKLDGRKGPKPKPIHWSEPVHGVAENGLFVEKPGGTIVIRYDMDDGTAYCINHQQRLSECLEKHA